jgi:isopentenyl-diphosphate delta-isomerase
MARQARVVKVDAMTEELVILVDDNDEPIGTAPKATVHTGATPLHRGFSCFVFNSAGELLLQQRAHGKVTWPGVWSNSVCGHPAPGEAPAAAVHRRLDHELGLKGVEIELTLPKYRYRAEYLGVVENEHCPVWIGFTELRPTPNLDEVAAVEWVPWPRFLDGVRAQSERFYRELSPWCREETALLATKALFGRFLEERGVTP